MDPAFTHNYNVNPVCFEAEHLTKSQCMNTNNKPTINTNDTIEHLNAPTSFCWNYLRQISLDNEQEAM